MGENGFSRQGARLGLQLLRIDHGLAALVEEGLDLREPKRGWREDGNDEVYAGAGAVGLGIAKEDERQGGMRAQEIDGFGHVVSAVGKKDGIRLIEG